MRLGLWAMWSSTARTQTARLTETIVGTGGANRGPEPFRNGHFHREFPSGDGVDQISVGITDDVGLPFCLPYNTVLADPQQRNGDHGGSRLVQRNCDFAELCQSDCGVGWHQIDIYLPGKGATTWR